MTKTYNQACPFARTLDLIGERWTVLIIRDLFLGAARFKELRGHSPGMPTKVLADRLKWLEERGIVARSLYSEHPPRAEYHLTELGRSLEPVFMAIYAWGMEHVMTARERHAVEARLRAHPPGGKPASTGSAPVAT